MYGYSNKVTCLRLFYDLYKPEASQIDSLNLKQYTSLLLDHINKSQLTKCLSETSHCHCENVCLVGFLKSEGSVLSVK